MIVHRFCCLHSRTSQGRGSVRGEPLTGSPTRVQSPARRRPLLRSKSAAPKRKHHPDGWCFLFGAGDEESAEAPPAAEEARRFRGSVLTAGRGSGWEPADTTVSAEEHAKKITTQMGGDLWSGRRGSNSLPSIPRMAVAIRRSPASPLDLTRFAQVEAASSLVLRHIPKRKHHPDGWCFLFGAGDEARTRYLDLGKVALYQMSYARKRKVDYSV